ncbi:YegP family protein [Pusillimonas sp. MFBS29]|uniref:YegP family protein n=1 Tax=Pusillimonas sp. MFBS29 TaxID=2886690 RepID=UPI001D117080|nr:YegP family protein [Pusillimonas sp. MFBS29]MCC2597149.1 YegP family protein [Pusillimonas sp. MFBS29]
MAGKFEIYKDKAGEFRFRLNAGNGQTILASEGYKSKASCLNGVESVKKNATSDSLFERKQTASGKHMFNLKARNGQVIGTSQLYDTEASRNNGIASVANHAPGAALDDSTAA